MKKHRAPALSDSTTFQQLWDALGSKMIESTQGNLLYTSASKVRDLHVLLLYKTQSHDTDEWTREIRKRNKQR